jgi:hypothetical protein
MKCAICKEKTNWDSSFGYKEFIVCPSCFARIHKEYDIVETMDIIFMLGNIIREKKGINK